MTSFSVDPAELIGLAGRTRARGAELAELPAGKYLLNAAELDVAELVAPLSAVQDASRQAMKIINGDLTALAERLAATAAGYRTVDEELARQLADVVAQRS
ncbi:type VII secretion target [Kutzneria chonburiensis]|uniref:Type VII secretion target n=1 Tax=Kutzneria chonburiensis TaxID=1483604 RepID=A0ABV6N494_9PSEU|nr:type VII secretion target [Kutzneria chonburiensis]